MPFGAALNRAMPPMLSLPDRRDKRDRRADLDDPGDRGAEEVEERVAQAFSLAHS